LTERLVNYKFGVKLKRLFTYLVFLIFANNLSFGQDATEIVRKANNLIMGETSQGINKMKVVRPDWEREVSMKIWSKGNDYYLILITAPAREKGQVFLKREKEMWNWIPSINRMIKIPPSMMAQSWMGSDFTNDDLLKEGSIVKDYDHTIIGSDSIEGYDCYKIELIPKPEAAVVWGKILTWIEKENYFQLRVEFYDETGDLINTQFGSEIKKMGNRILPAKMVMIPSDKEGNQTIIELIDVEFDKKISDKFFSQQNMKRIR